MARYVGSRPMFLDVEAMQADIRTVLGEQGTQPTAASLAHGLSILYREIIGAIREKLCYFRWHPFCVFSLCAFGRDCEKRSFDNSCCVSLSRCSHVTSSAGTIFKLYT
jgi:hypothetical protein